MTLAQACQIAYVGHNLGWYKLLERAGSAGLTAVDLASQSSSSTRYAQEWLEHQAVSKWIRCLNPEQPDALVRRFALPPAHASVLADGDSLSYLMPLIVLAGGTGKAVDGLIRAYKNDTGVSWEEFGEDARESQGAMNRPFFLQVLPGIMEKIIGPEASHKLKTKGGRIADIGAGYAYSSIGLAKHFGACHVDAYDLDAPSIQRATQLITEEGLAGRIQAHCVDAAETLGGETFDPCDLVVALECIHDLSDPISVLRTMRGLAGNGKGAVIVMDERVDEDFSSGLTSPTSIDQIFYGFSCTCCLADCKSHPNSMETGTVMRPKVLRAYAQQAGFKDIEALEVAPKDCFFRFYRLIG
jgi:2-polyprenyl-3-methyl-5-hydroxy-6-metoxy-1,4-benzoquinol methylase